MWISFNTEFHLKNALASLKGVSPQKCNSIIKRWANGANSNYQNVDVTTPVQTVRKPLSGAAEEEASDALLHVVEAEDWRGNRPEIICLFVFREKAMPLK